MEKILVVYKSSTGFTLKYARWIAQALQCDLADVKEVSARKLSGYDTVIFGSRAHAGRIDGYRRIRDLVQKSDVSRFLLFVTGAMPAEAEETVEEFWKQNLTEEERKEVSHFYMPGGLCYERMSLPDRLMMKAFSAMLGKKAKSEDEVKMARMIEGSYDLSDRKYLEPLIALF